jgi:HEAT repeat protein/scaffold Nfu/NifU family protein
VDVAPRDALRNEVAARGLTPVAVAHLARDALGRIELDRLAPVKALLKRFFSDAPWTTEHDDELARLVGPGEGWWRYELDEGTAFAFGWQHRSFRLELEQSEPTNPAAGDAATGTPRVLDEDFDGAIVPEATPNPRTIRFVIGRIHTGASRWYESAAQVDDPRVARLFAEFDDVANVLVGPDFVAVGLRRANRWEQLLGPMLRVLETEFPTEPSETDAPHDPSPAAESRPVDVRAPASLAGERAFDRAWRELHGLQLDRHDDLERLVAAVSSPDVTTRQAAARVLIDADPDVARTAWGTLVADPSRTVRRATIDAMVDADRPALRPLLERALQDPDPWARWKAVRGLVELGIDASRAVVSPLAIDTDFRVRLEATRALRRS